MAISDEESARAWLEGEGRTREEQVAIAARAALRALPGLGMAGATQTTELVLASLRTIVTSVVMAKMPTLEVRKAAETASSISYSTTAAHSARSSRNDNAATVAYSATAARFATSDTHSAMKSSADTAFYAARSHASPANARPPAARAAAAYSAAFSATDRDAREIEESGLTSVFDRSLWPDGGIPDFFDVGYGNLQRFWDATPATWDFWKRWYEGMLRGQPLPWEFQRDVALIPEGEWEKGPERIAEVIRGIEAEHRGAPQTDAIEAERERGGDALRRHVQRLLKRPNAGEINAVGLAMQIKSAVDAYCNSGPNDLPEEVQHLDDIARLLAKIGGTFAKVKLDKQETQNYADELEKQVAELQLRIKALEAELIEAKGKQVTGFLKQGFLFTIGAEMALSCTTGFLGALTYFAAPEFASDVTQSLGDTITGWFEREQIEFPQIGVDRSD